jgi:hypothetical protein
VERVTFFLNEQPFEFVQSTVRGDRYAIVLELMKNAGEQLTHSLAQSSISQRRLPPLPSLVEYAAAIGEWNHTTLTAAMARRRSTMARRLDCVGGTHYVPFHARAFQDWDLRTAERGRRKDAGKS